MRRSPGILGNAAWILGSGITGCCMATMLFLSTALAQGVADDRGRAEALVVMIKGRLGEADTLGAGIIFAYASNRLYIATANHVVRRGQKVAEELQVELKALPGERFEAKLLDYFDSNLDLAILSLVGVDRHAIPADSIAFDRLADTGALVPGAGVYPVGYARGEAWARPLRADVVSRIDGAKILFESNFIGPGHSGGALFNDRWELVGMVRADQPPNGAAVRIDSILAAVAARGYPVSLKPAARATASAATAEPASPAARQAPAAAGRRAPDESRSPGPARGTDASSRPDQDYGFLAQAEKAEATILANIQSADYSRAIVQILEYEKLLLSRYPPPTFEDEQFRSERHHVAFRSAFSGWRPDPSSGTSLRKSYSKMGADPLLMLRGRDPADKLMVLSLDLGKSFGRMGLDADDIGQNPDKLLVSMSRLMSMSLGKADEPEFEQIGEIDVLQTKLVTQDGLPGLLIALPAHDGKGMIGFMLVTSPRTAAQNTKMLHETIESTNLQYHPSDLERIKGIRSTVTAKEDLRGTLAATRFLAMSQEYNAAADALREVYTHVVEQLSTAAIEGNVGVFPAYGVSLKNPDEKRWGLQVQDVGSTKALVLTDRGSVKSEAIMIYILDPLTLYGSGVVEMTENDAELKKFLVSVGRAVLMTVGSGIEREQFSTFKGGMAYEAIASANLTGVKAKVRIADQSTFFLMILMLADESAFDEKFADYDNLLSQDWLSIQSQTVDEEIEAQSQSR